MGYIRILRCLYTMMALALPGCALVAESEQGHLHCEARYSAGTFQEMMKFDYSGWQSAKPYALRPASISGSGLNEGGNVRFLWNGQYLFVLGDMEDSDIVQECDEDNQHLYKTRCDGGLPQALRAAFLLGALCCAQPKEKLLFLSRPDSGFHQ